MEVKVIDNKLEHALRTLKRKLVMNGVFKEIKKTEILCKTKREKKTETKGGS